MDRHSRRVVVTVAGLAALTVSMSACATLGAGSREQIIRQILASTVQLRTQREGGARRSASGVVLAADTETRRSWIITTKHVVEPLTTQEIYVGVPGHRDPLKASVAAVSAESDLALLEAQGLALPPVQLKEAAKLGDDVWIVAFPWGRKRTVVGGIVSQVESGSEDALVEGPARMVDASVSYGASGGGVFDAVTGALVGVVQSYRTARVGTGGSPERVIEIPVPGETTLISAEAIVRFVQGAGLAGLIRN
jgi:serine protease Do